MSRSIRKPNSSTEETTPTRPLHQIKVDVMGRLRNTKVSPQHSFLPIFEAVVNSIHSTEERFGDDVASKGRVEIQIHRVPQGKLPEFPGRIPIVPISSFAIIDNGMGFTDRNQASFETADSREKIGKGGKGVGRFTWLVVFQDATIRSTYKVDGQPKMERSFKFCPTETGISDYKEAKCGGAEDIETRIDLNNVQKDYVEALRKSADVMTEQLFEHCFNYFVLGRCPVVRIVDISADGNTEIKVNDCCAELTLEEPKPLDIGPHRLSVRHVQQQYKTGRKHQVHLCANERAVMSFPLTDICDLEQRAIPVSGKDPVVHHVYVSGEALDNAADQTRTRFYLPDGDPDPTLFGALDLRDLRERLGEHVNEHLKDLLEAERHENFLKIESHIKTAQPEYRPLLLHRREQIERLKWTDDKRRLDENLYRVHQDFEVEVRRRQSEVEQKMEESDADLDALTKDLEQIILEINEVGQTNLVRYVVKRRAVLNLLNRMISKFSGPALEEQVHKIVLPLRMTGENVAMGDHNLWLVDDTLSFYEYLASDISFSANEVAPVESPQRPDIIAFKSGDPFQHVAIVEFKRPGRDDSNPVDQLAKYGLLLRRGGKLDVNGVLLPALAQSVRIDAYAVVTLSPEMEEKMRVSPGDLKRVEGESRWLGHMTELNMTIEVLDFRAFIRRAEQRNRTFFTKLGLL